MKTRKFVANGTTCESCERIIERQALSVQGVESVRFDWTTEEGTVTFDENKVDLKTILHAIEEKNYACQAGSRKRSIGWMPAIIGVIVVTYFLLKMSGIEMPAITQNLSYGLLFAVGLITGLHCVAMCGGFVVSYTAKAAKEGRSAFSSHVVYGSAKTISYTIIGAVFGLIGSALAFTPGMRGTAGIIAGVFLILFGLRMLNVIPKLRNFGFRLPRPLMDRVSLVKKKHNGPLIIGLLNGLMIACGPLQAIYIMAAGTGSALEGAKILFIFGLGTLPAMLGFGVIATYLSNKATRRILKASGAIVIILGIIMLNNGLTLTGTGLDAGSLMTSVTAKSGLEKLDSPTIVEGYQEIRMDVTSRGWVPNSFVLEKGVPVRWIINGKEITGCNNAIVVPQYDLEFDIRPGEQVIMFTPDKEGVVRWSCWMGMIPGTFIVKESLEGIDIAAEAENAAPPMGGSCGCARG